MRTCITQYRTIGNERVNDTFEINNVNIHELASYTAPESKIIFKKINELTGGPGGPATPSTPLIPGGPGGPSLPRSPRGPAGPCN